LGTYLYNTGQIVTRISGRESSVSAYWSPDAP